MARKVKCKICKRELTTDLAFKVTKENKQGKKVNFYYCSEKEYLKQQKDISDRKSMFEVVANILDVKIISSAFMKQLNEVLVHYEPVVVEKTFKECEPAIRRSLDKSFFSEFAKAKYMIAIIKNNIDEVYKKHKKEMRELERLFAKEETTIDMEILNADAVATTTRKVTDISSFLD